MAELNPSTMLVDDSAMEELVSRLPERCRVAIPWISEAHSLLNGDTATYHSAAERKLAAHYCAIFAADKVASAAVGAEERATRDQLSELLRRAAMLLQAEAVAEGADLQGSADEKEPEERASRARYSLPRERERELSPSEREQLDEAMSLSMRRSSAADPYEGERPSLVDALDEMDDGDPVSGMIKMAQEFLEAAEAAAELGNRHKSSLEFHSVFVYLEVVRSLRGGLDPNMERVQAYALWRSHEHAHLLTNCVHEHGAGEATRAAGRRLQDRYEIHADDILGQGSFGAVRVGLRRQREGEPASEDAERVAVKTIATASMPPRKIRKLHEEVSIMREADHPHIVRLLEVFFSPRGRVHLVMELCSGGTLYDYLDQFEAQHVHEEALGALMLRQMLSAVRYLHQMDVVHCDIKLENWLLEAPCPPVSGTAPVLKLIDFGLSRHVDPTHRRTIHEACGTIFYVAPEVLTEASEGFGPECDLWSTGVVAYMMLTGSPPFFGRHNAETKAQILRADPSYSSRLFAHCEGGKRGPAASFVRGLLTRDPSRRLTAAQAIEHRWVVKHARPQSPRATPLPETRDAAPPLGAAGGGSSSMSADGFFGSVPSLVQSASSSLRRSAAAAAPALLTRSELVHSLRGFRELSTLSKLICELAASRLKPDELAELRGTFEAIDGDGSGTISFDELRAALLGEKAHAPAGHRRRATLPEGEIQEIFDSISVRHDDHGVSYHEFLAAAMWRRVDLDEARLQEIFEMLDVGHTGRVKVEQLAQTCGADFRVDVIEQIMEELDTDRDGDITYSDLVKAWRTHVVDRHLNPLLEASAQVPPTEIDPRRSSVSLADFKLS